MTPSGFKELSASAGRALPSILNYDKNKSATLRVLRTIRQHLGESAMRFKKRELKAQAKGRIVREINPKGYWPFETVNEVSLSAALVLAAEYERYFKLTGVAPRLVNVHKWKAPVIATLREIGFFEVVGFKKSVPLLTGEESASILKMRSGETADSVAVSEVVADLKALYPQVEDENEANMLQLYGAMVEAVVNVVRHAYPENAVWDISPINRWWITGAVDRQSRWMTAVVFDQGVTIPVSLPNWNRYSGLRRRLFSMLGVVPESNNPKSDGYAIAAAVEEAVSSTGLAHRGKGFAQMREFVDNCRDGHLRILSRSGEVIFRPSGRREIYSHSFPIGGTLIEWSVAL